MTPKSPREALNGPARLEKDLVTLKRSIEDIIVIESIQWLFYKSLLTTTLVLHTYPLASLCFCYSTLAGPPERTRTSGLQSLPYKYWQVRCSPCHLRGSKNYRFYLVKRRLRGVRGSKIADFETTYFMDGADYSHQNSLHAGGPNMCPFLETKVIVVASRPQLH